MNELQTLIASGRPLFITIDGFRQAMLTAFPLYEKADGKSAKSNYTKAEMLAYLTNHTAYQLETHLALLKMQQKMAQDNDTITLTDEFDDEQLPDNSIAYHRVWGTIMANSYWYFSSKQLEADLKSAEANPQISCHFLHINSPGGEAWYLDRLSATFRECKKPIQIGRAHV